MKNALISVSDKSNLTPLCKFLLNNNFNIFSTGGTYNLIKDISDKNIYEIKDLTNFPEILEGRVKTLHPKVYAGILAKKDNPVHKLDVTEHNCIYFDLIVVNLYPFQEVVNKSDLDTCIENIDIGGVSLIRAACKNYSNVLLLSNPNQYDLFTKSYKDDNNLGYSIELRKQMASKGFRITSQYDNLISNYLSDNDSLVALKYGMNPHQKNSYIQFNEVEKPFSVLNGYMGFINVLDAIHGWLTVCELDDLLNYPAAISMKHTSLAGLAIGNDISKNIINFFDLDENEKENISETAMAFMKSRIGDPLSSFGDFICISREVDVFTANLIKKEVCDGIAAPSFSKEALEILSSKKNGKFIILKMNTQYYENMKENGWEEYRSLYGFTIKQNSNTYKTILDKNVPEDIKLDLILANTALKYSQSNNISIAYKGQIIGMGCGQQNRVACVKLAGEKALNWVLRQTKGSYNFWNESKNYGKRQERVNLLYDHVKRLIEQIMITKHRNGADLYFEELRKENRLVLASDGFFPFPDNIKEANNYLVKYIIQPGGSISDSLVEEECKRYDIKMYYTGTRMFYH